MDDKISVTITIESVEDKGKQIKLKGGGKTFSFWKTKIDGADTSAYEQFLSMDIGTGSTVNVSYVVEPFTLPDGKAAHSNKIIWFREADGLPVPLNSQPANTSGREQKSSPRSNSGVTEQTKWDEIAVGKVQSLFLAAYIQSGKSIEETRLQLVTTRKLAERVVYGREKQEELPTIQQETQDDDEDIPPIGIYDDPTNGEPNPMVNDTPF